MHISDILRKLGKMHKEHGWDVPVGDAFEKIADWLDNFIPMPL